MKAILINSEKRQVSEVEYNGDYKEINRLIGSEVFCIGAYLPNDDCVFVDDEGLLKEPKFFFKVPSYPNPLAGNGLVLGTNGFGESTSAKSKLEELKKQILFEDINTVGFKVQLGIYK